MSRVPPSDWLIGRRGTPKRQTMFCNASVSFIADLTTGSVDALAERKRQRLFVPLKNLCQRTSHTNELRSWP